MSGDSYIVKPFLSAILVANVNAHLRRSSMHESMRSQRRLLRFRGFKIDLAGCEVTRAAQRAPVTATEFKLLRFLAIRPRQVFTRDQLIRYLRHDQWAANTNTVVVHIRRLCEKFEDYPSNPRYVATVGSLGYRFTRDA